MRHDSGLLAPCLKHPRQVVHVPCMLCSDNRRPGEEREAFSSKLLPPYLRKTKSIEELLPWLYLGRHGRTASSIRSTWSLSHYPPNRLRRPRR